MNSDGRMDIHEFSIAMKLIKLKLQGHPLPPSLPPSMKQPPLAIPPQTGFGKSLQAFIFEINMKRNLDTVLISRVFYTNYAVLLDNI